METNENGNYRDPELWKKAKKRANFKNHLYTYFVINLFLWALWGIKGFMSDGEREHTLGFPWPLWVTLGWGIGVAMDYYNAYFGDKETRTEREYEKLLKKKQKD